MVGNPSTAAQPAQGYGSMPERSEAVAGREHATEEAGGGSESGQGDAEGGDRKKRMELVDQRSDASWLRMEYAASERRVCGLLTMAVASYCYRTRRSC
jgi:hypothetical protein